MTTQAKTESEQDILSRLVQWHESADQATVDGRADSERDRDYYDGRQLTDAEIDTLNKRKQPVVIINRIKPKVDFLRGQEQQRRRMPRAFPRTPAEEEGATAATDALRYVMEQAKWDRVRSGCFDEFIVEGTCGVDVQVYKKPGPTQEAEYCVDPKQIRWDRLWYDPHSRAPDYSDAAYKGQFIWMDLEDATAKWPEKKDALESTLAQESGLNETYEDVPRMRWADPKRKRVRIAECWSREGDKVYFTQYTKAGILSRIESPFVDEDGYPDDGFVFGSCFIDRDGVRYGVVRAWISIQDEINKRRSKALHLMNVRQTYGNQAIGDKNALRQELAKPDGHVELAGGAKMGEDFGVLPTGDMAAAQMEMLREAKGEIDAVGVNAALSGKEDRVMSGRALMARGEQGMSELGPVFDAFAQFEHDVYRKCWNRIRQLWTAEKWIRVTDDEKNVRFVGLNQPLTLGEQLLEEFKKSGAGPEEIAQAEQQAKMDPAMQRVVGTKNKVAELDVDIILDEVPAAVNLQTETFEQLMEIAPHAAAMPPPMFEALLEASPLRGETKQRVLKKLRGEEDGKLPPQVQQQMAQMEQALQEAQERAAKAEAQAMQAKAMGPAADLERRELELQYREKLLQAQKRIAVLEVRSAQVDAEHAAQELDRATGELNEAAAEAQKQTEAAEVPLN
jgi:hypothetical protein